MPFKVGFATPLLLRVGVDSARERAVFSSSRFGVCTRHCDRFGNYKQRKKRDPMDGDRRRRTPLKSRHPDLKEKVRIVLLVLIFLIILFSFMQLRQCCLERIKEERNQLLWKIRSGRQQSQETEVCVYHINKMMLRLIGQLGHQARVMTFGIRANLVFGHGEGTLVGKDYLQMESKDSSQCGATTGLHLICTMIGFDLGYVGGLDEGVKLLSRGDCNIPD
ncbi:hypothetical protein GW17_00005555 [Ensete ventricosum]|nr:hypothetical protein GW17_00005555 [Ensete ventricosum]